MKWVAVVLVTVLISAFAVWQVLPRPDAVEPLGQRDSDSSSPQNPILLGGGDMEVAESPRDKLHVQGDLDALIAELRVATEEERRLDEAKLRNQVIALGPGFAEEVGGLLADEISAQPRVGIAHHLGDILHAYSRIERKDACVSLCRNLVRLAPASESLRAQGEVRQYLRLLSLLVAGELNLLDEAAGLLVERRKPNALARRGFIQLIREVKAVQFKQPLRVIVSDSTERMADRVEAARTLVALGDVGDLWAALEIISKIPDGQAKSEILIAAASFGDRDLAYQLIRDVVRTDDELTLEHFQQAVIRLRRVHGAQDPAGTLSFIEHEARAEAEENPLLSAQLYIALGHDLTPEMLRVAAGHRDVQDGVVAVLKAPERYGDIVAATAASAWVGMQTRGPAVFEMIDSTEDVVSAAILAKAPALLTVLGDERVREAYRQELERRVLGVLRRESSDWAKQCALTAGSILGQVDMAAEATRLADSDDESPEVRAAAKQALDQLSAILTGTGTPTGRSR